MGGCCDKMNVFKYLLNPSNKNTNITNTINTINTTNSSPELPTRLNVEIKEQFNFKNQVNEEERAKKIPKDPEMEKIIKELQNKVKDLENVVYNNKNRIKELEDDMDYYLSKYKHLSKSYKKVLIKMGYNDNVEDSDDKKNDYNQS